jgi:hypothetical protein
MTQEEYSGMLEAVGALVDEVKAERVEDYTLTQEEKDALADIPEHILEEAVKMLGQYKTESIDIRGDLIAKALARLWLRMPLFVKSFKIGYAHGRLA